MMRTGKTLPERVRATRADNLALQQDTRGAYEKHERSLTKLDFGVYHDTFAIGIHIDRFYKSGALRSMLEYLSIPLDEDGAELLKGIREQIDKALGQINGEMAEHKTIKMRMDDYDNLRNDRDDLFEALKECYWRVEHYRHGTEDIETVMQIEDISNEAIKKSIEGRK